MGSTSLEADEKDKGTHGNRVYYPKTRIMAEHRRPTVNHSRKLTYIHSVIAQV